MKKVLVVVSLIVAMAFVYTANVENVEQRVSNISICHSADAFDAWVNPASLDLFTAA